MLLEDVEAARVGAIDSEQLADQLVDHVRGPLAGADLAGEFLKQASPGRNINYLELWAGYKF